MAKSKNKSKNEEIQVLEEPTNVEGTEEELSPWYAFCSTGCGFCKKAEPIIEELNKEGYDILTLDIAEPDNKNLNEELKAKYKIQCGTPWFINAETGKGICGYREKDIMKKWLDGEDIPAPPRPKGMPPKPPLMGSTGKEEADWKKAYKTWLDDNQHLPKERRKSADEILAMPRPKSDPPKPPMGPNMTDNAIDKWGKEYKVWSEENKHLPNLQPADKIVMNMKNRAKQMANMPQQGQPQPPMGGNFEQRLGMMEQKIDKLMNHLGVK